MHPLISDIFFDLSKQQLKEIIRSYDVTEVEDQTVLKLGKQAQCSI